MKKPLVLTIGGSDPSCGAGIQADIRSFQLLNIHPISVITCITMQNTSSLEEIIPLPVNQIEKQIDLIMADVQPTFVKTGLLFSEEIINLIAKKQKEYNWKLVVDPIITSSTGTMCITDDYISALKNTLIPKSFMITPNIPEANQIVKTTIKNIDSMKQTAKTLYKLGCKSVFLKGGHLQKQKQVIDIFYDGITYDIFTLPSIETTDVHGTGCVLSSLITGYLSKKETPKISVQKAKHALWQMIKFSYKPGKGMNVTDLYYPTYKTKPPFFQSVQYQSLWMEFSKALPQLIAELSDEFIAEVGCNMGYALQKAVSFKDICSFRNRLTKPINKNELPSLSFGSSKHIASIILSVMNFFPDVRCAMNIRYTDKMLKSCKKSTDNIASFDRLNEPKETKSTMEWGTTRVLKSAKRYPEIIYDKGGVGKEPMIRLIGKNPNHVLLLLSKIKQHL